MRLRVFIKWGKSCYFLARYSYGSKCGFPLPCSDPANFLLFQAMYMLTLVSYLEERAVKLKWEALGRCQVALAGSPPNSLHYIIDQFFGFKDDTGSEASEQETQETLQSFTRLLTSEPVHATLRSFMASAEAAVAKLSAEQGTTAHAITALPAHLRPGAKAKASSQLFSGSESEGGRQHPGPLSTHAQIFKPGPDENNGPGRALRKNICPNPKRVNTSALHALSMKDIPI